MFGPPPGTRVYLACGATDMRKGFDGLAAQVQTVLSQDPYSGAVFCFRGRRGDLLKILVWDGQGLVLVAKRLEKGRFVWPQATSGVVSLTPAMLSMLSIMHLDAPPSDAHLARIRHRRRCRIEAAVMRYGRRLDSGTDSARSALARS
jgi:transposase